MTPPISTVTANLMPSIYFGLAGIWEHWQGEEGKVIESCSIITTVANGLMRGIHDRMPAILKTQDVKAWLNPGTEQKEVLAMLDPYPGDLLEAYPVSSMVNSSRNNNSECVERLNP